MSYYNFQLKTQTIPDNHTWILGGTAYQDAVSYGHAEPSRLVETAAAPIVLYQKIVYTWGPLLGSSC